MTSISTTTDTAEAVQASVTPDEYRQALGSFASGVTVITSLDGADPVGTTVSAFSALSMDPPLVLVCLASTSNTLAHIERSGFFGVNILASGQSDHALRFASSKGTNKFESIDFCAGGTGAPLLTGASATIDCVLHEILPGGDHAILLGHAQSSVVNLELAPLTYFRGAFVDVVDRHANA